MRLDSAQFDQGVRAAQTQMTAAAGSADRLAGAVDTSAAALSNAGRSSAVGARGTASFRAAQLSAVAATERYNALLNQEGVSLGRLASAEATAIRANERVTATTRAAAAAQAKQVAAIRETNTAAVATPGLMARSASGFASAGKAALGLGALFGAFELARKALDVTKQANEFQRAMVQVQTNADVTAAEVHKAAGALLAMAGPVAAAPADLALAWYHAKSVGLDYAKSIETTRIAAEGARVGNANLEETMNALTSTVASGIPGVKDMSGAMGQLIAIVGSGDMKLSDLNQALGSGILTVVKGYGLSLTDVGAALATFGDNNIRGAHAATMLRMAVQAMAVPAKAASALIGDLGLTSEGSAKALEKVHLTTSTLAKDMQTGGLNKAILDLKKHLDAAGVTSVQVGQVLTEMFGKKAGPGIAVLLGQVDRLESKFKILRDSSASFGDKWQATTQTASFALASLGHKLEALGITLTQKLGPGIAQSATWLGTTIPSALHTLEVILAPLIHTVGVVLVGAWQALKTVLGVVGSTLSAVGGYLARNKELVKGVTTAVLLMWGAFKAYEVARFAIVGVTALINRLGATAETTAMRLSTTSGMLGGLAIGMTAAAIGGFALENAIEGSNNALTRAGALVKSFADEITAADQAQSTWRDMLQQSNGVLTDSIRLSIAKQLQDEGLAEATGKLGVSLNDVIDAVTGSNESFTQLMTIMKQNGTLTGQQVTGLIELYGAYHTAGREAGQLNTVTAKHTMTVAADTSVMQWNIDAHGRLVETSAKAGSALDNTTGAMARQTLASTILKNAIDALNGVNLSIESTSDALSIALGNLANHTALAAGANGKVSRSLDQSTVAGATNRQMLVSLIQAAKDEAQAVADQAKAHGYGLPAALKAGNAALAANEEKIRAAARAAGLNADQVNALINSIGKLAIIHVPTPKPKIDPKPAQTQIQKLQAEINAIRQGKVPGLTVDIEAAYQRIKYLESLIAGLKGVTIGINAGFVGPGSSTYRSQVPTAPAIGGLIGAKPSPTSITVNQVINNPLQVPYTTSGPAGIRYASTGLAR
jgi:TP901 family phage tail tape measure protein